MYVVSGKPTFGLRGLSGPAGGGENFDFQPYKANLYSTSLNLGFRETSVINRPNVNKAVHKISIHYYSKMTQSTLVKRSEALQT